MGMLQPSHGQYIRSGSQRIMQMVFQDPLSSLNPRLPVWRIITEPLWIAKRSSEQQRRALAEELAVQVGIRPEVSRPPASCVLRRAAATYRHCQSTLFAA
ncbi:putative D,D-dipeptide transport ATP-binding protein ddpF [Escherichia coli]|uniref:Putative D,D-dipeptide transport ATP-binding protein ddpF n=1 Tax=Escherichia coli TaxID=562 RepID=A0A377BHP6_ECOLX|nr:putative D,D-dipeptide transport ATP-binding protein ddpF [Escherichia coli]